jgi:hypothetical protein
MALSPLDRPRSESMEGDEVCTAFCLAADQFRSSITYGEPFRVSMESLQEVADGASFPDWDGYGAEPLTEETLVAAKTFLELIPFELPLPEIGVASTGDISFEWAQSPSRIVSVGVSGDGIVHYASMNGIERSFGSYPMGDNFNPKLRDLIYEVLG